MFGFLDGKTTYILGVIMVLLGIYFAIQKNQIGYQMIVEGLAILGLRDAIRRLNQ
jgi:hypothetical protein